MNNPQGTTTEKDLQQQATAWANEVIFDGSPDTVERPRLEMHDAKNGRRQTRVDLPTPETIRPIIGTACVKLAFHTRFGGTGRPAPKFDFLKVHPRIAVSEEAVREGLVSYVQELREEAALLLADAARYESLLDQEWEA